jgi:hypothetical protein
VSRLRKTPQPFRWTAIPVAFTQGTAASVNLAAYLSNPQGRTITYSTVGSLPTGVTLSGSTVSYNGTAVASTVSVRFRATSGSYEADSDVTTVSIAAPPITNSDPVWLTPTNLGTITANTPFSFTLTAVDADSDPISFIVGALPGAATATPQVQSGTSRAVVVAGTGLSVGTYTFTINADDEPPLGQVFGLVASTLSTTSIGLVWTAVSNATSYQVERSFTGTGTWTVLGTVATASYTSTGLDPGTLYFYRVRALSATQTGEYSAAASATTVALGDAETDWTIRSTLPGTVFAHDFRDDAEITAFIKGGAEEDADGDDGRDAMKTRRSTEGIPGTLGGSVASRSCGSTLVNDQPVATDGTVEDWEIADGTTFPDPADGGAYAIILGQNDNNGEGVLVTAKRAGSIAPRSILTVVRGNQGTPKNFLAGEQLGSDPSDNWHRPLCAVAAPNNGKTVNDIGITQGHSIARAWVNGPRAHSRVPFAHWGKELANYTDGFTDEIGGVWTENPFEGEEFYLQFRVKFPAARFVAGENGKWFYVDGVASGVQQTFGNIQGVGDGSAPVGGAWIRSYGDSRAIAGNRFVLPGATAAQPGGDYPLCMTNDERNTAECFAFPPDQWITFLFHYRPGLSNYSTPFTGTLANDHTFITRTITTQEDDIVVVGDFPDPATWGTYPLQIRDIPTTGGSKQTEIVKVLSKSGQTLHVLRNWWRSTAGGLNPTIAAGGIINYGPNNEAPQNGEASWLQDPYLCPNYDSFISIYAAYEGETTYRTVMQSPGLPFIYGMNSTQGNYSRPGFNSDTLPGFCFFKPESYMNAYFGSGSQGPPGGHTVRYTQIILSRNFIPCPQ